MVFWSLWAPVLHNVKVARLGHESAKVNLDTIFSTHTSFAVCKETWKWSLLSMEPSERRDNRLSRRRQYERHCHASESIEAREQRLAGARTRRQQRLTSESAEERETHSLRCQAQERARCAAQPHQMGETCQQQLREAQQRRQAAETSEETEMRLHLLQLAQQQQLEAETPAEREARLYQLRVSQQQRLVVETPGRREVRLQQMRSRQQQRIASETPQENETRRRRDREGHIQQALLPCSAQPLLHCPSVQSQMSKFHSRMDSLQVSSYATCMERFPGMAVRMTSAGTECIRCTKDQHSPKTFSSGILDQYHRN